MRRDFEGTMFAVQMKRRMCLAMDATVAKETK